MAFHATCQCGACAEPVQRLTAALEELFERRGWENTSNAANKIAHGYRYGSAEAFASIPIEFIERNARATSNDIGHAISQVLSASRGVLHDLR